MNLQLIPIKKPVKVSITIPGSKSYTNRALLLAALTDNAVKISKPLVSDDTHVMISCLKTLGIQIVQKPNALEVRGNISHIQNKTFALDANLSATTIRFLLALSAIIPGTKILTGKPGLLARPIGDLVEALRKLGVKIEYLDKKGFPPIKIMGQMSQKSQGNQKKILDVNGSISSQFLSSMLMLLPKLGNTTIHLNNLVSKSYVDMTIEMMKQFGVLVENDNYKSFRVKDHQEYNASKIAIEGDVSSATYFAAIAALTKSTITLKNINPKSKQGDLKFFEILESMGNKIIKRPNEITIIGKMIKPVSVNMESYPDSIQTLAVLTAFANGKSKIKGIQTLRIKETNRVQALQNELQKMGIKVEAVKNLMVIHGGNPKPAVISTYNDHRMALSFAVAGTKLSGMVIEHTEVVSKTFPDFWDELRKIGIDSKKVAPTRIVLVGFMGTGKSSVAPLVARHLHRDVIEMDELILNKSRRQSIEEIFEKDGEHGGKKTFRSLEFEVSKEIKSKENVVISTGGGVITNEALMRNLKNDSLVVFLDTALKTIRKRLSDIKSRPLWKNQQDAQKLYNQRLPLYKRYADIIVQTDGKSLGQVSQEILAKIEIF